jgi:CBS domain containing-hemolysin-like protein
VLENFTLYNCVLHSLPEGHFELATKRNLELTPNMTTILQITNTNRAKKLPHDLQAQFVRSALLLQEYETTIGNITWNDIFRVKNF